jgi:hypothetical protein
MRRALLRLEPDFALGSRLSSLGVAHFALEPIRERAPGLYLVIASFSLLDLHIFISVLRLLGNLENSLRPSTNRWGWLGRP